MQLTEEHTELIVNMQTIGQGVKLLRGYAIDNPTLRPLLKKITYGVEKKFHYQRYELGMYTEKQKHGYVTIGNTEMTYEELWDEIDERIARAQKALLEMLEEPDPTASKQNI